ncbi:MAG: PAS domain S-box protein, partial [Candidatus Omnitrophota bacterium]
ETGPQVTIIFDLNAKIIACSRRITEILGYTVAEIVNKSGFSFASESDQEKAKQLLGEVLQKKEVKGFLLKIRHKNKTIRDISFNVSLMPGESEEKQASIVCVIEDVTERLADVENLKESKNQYQKVAQEYALTQEATLNILEDLQESKNAVEADRRGFLNIIENIRDGIVIVDEDGIVKFANKSAQDICDTELIEMIEKPFAYVINMNEVGKVKINHRNGRTALVELRVSKTEWMQQTMSLVVMHDITQQEEAKNLLLRAAEEWRCTFDAIGDGVSLLNVEGKVIRCNNAAARIFNKPFPDVIGTDCHDFSHAGQKAPDCVINRAIQLGERSTEICKKDEKWYLFSADPLISKGKVTGVVHTMSDITEQKNTENKMREYAEYIENIVETAQSLIIVLDKELRIKSINRFAEDLFGYKRKDIIGSEWIDLVTPSDYKDEIRQVLMTCLEGDRVIGYEMPVIARDEKEIMISWYSAELLDADGKIVGIVTMGYDISQRKEIEKVQRLAQLGTLVSHMAHEVNNPLMVISGRAQLALMEDIQNQEVKDNLEVVINECKRAKDIIQRLLRFSRPSKGEIHEVDINKSLEEVVGLLEHQFGLENIAILTDIAPNLPSIKGDEKQLIEVFMNLLTNAHDAIEGEGSIRIEVKEKKGFVKITFKDTGMGMSKQVMDKIFDPFFTTKKKGTGLGLSICYSIIKAHNGDLKFESIEGRGTTAVILLPVLKPSYDEESAGMS